MTENQSPSAPLPLCPSAPLPLCPPAPLPLCPSAPLPPCPPAPLPQISALGLDIGRKRIGVAGCDRTGLIATGLTTIERKSFTDDIAQFQQLVAEREVEILVVGLPYSMDGTLGYQAKQVQKLARSYAKALNLPLEYVDERLTSFQAEELLKAENRSPSRNKNLIDRKAAAIILQQWLDERRKRQQHRPPLEPNHV